MLNIHFGQKRPAIFHHYTDAITTKTDMQDSTKRQSPVSGYKLIVVIDLAIRQKLTSLHWSRSADPIRRNHKYKWCSVHMLSCTLGCGYVMRKLTSSPTMTMSESFANCAVASHGPPSFR